MPEGVKSTGETLRFLGRGSLLALATGLVCAVAAYYLTSRETPSYRATSVVYATKGLPNDHNMGLVFYTPEALDADAYGFAVTSRDVIEAALRSLDGGKVPAGAAGKLASNLHVSSDETGSASFVHITVQASSGKQAAAEANALATAVVAWDAARAKTKLDRAAQTLEAQLADLKSRAAALTGSNAPDAGASLNANVQLQGQIENQIGLIDVLRKRTPSALTVFQLAGTPSEPSGPRTKLNTILAYVFGLIIGYLALLGYEAVAVSIKEARADASGSSG